MPLARFWLSVSSNIAEGFHKEFGFDNISYLLYRFFDQISKKEKLDVKFLNLREILLANYKDFLQLFFQIADRQDHI